MNQAGKPIIAIDMPSGIHADNGTLLGQAVNATATVTFGLPKLGLYFGAGIDHAGTIHVVDIAFPLPIRMRSIAEPSSSQKSWSLVRYQHAQLLLIKALTAMREFSPVQSAKPEQQPLRHRPPSVWEPAW